MNSITAFIFDLSKGGAQGVFVTVMNYFADNGYDVRVVVQNLKDDVHREKLADSIKIHSLECSNAKGSLMKIIKYIKSNEIEKAWVFGPELAVNLYAAKCICRKAFPIYARSINTLSEEFKRSRSFFRKFITHSIIKLFYNKVDAIVAQSENMGDDLIKNYGFDPKKVHIINNALSNIYDKEINCEANQKRKNYLLYAGRLEKQKGLKMLLKAFSMIEECDINLYLVGEGSQNEELKNMAVELEIDYKVRFIGYTENMLQYYKNATATVLTSYYEGFPNVLIESLACGTPVVSFDLPSGPREIINSENGLLVEYMNIEQMAEAMKIAFAMTWDRSCIKDSAKRYSQSNILHKYLELMTKD